MHGKFRRGSFQLALILFPLFLAAVACLVLGSYGGAQGLKTISDSFAAGALAFLPKPLTAARLHSTVRLAISTNREARRALSR